MSQSGSTLDRVSAVALESTVLLLAFALPFEIIHPLLTLGPWLAITNLEIILGLAILAWLLRAAATRRLDLRTPLTPLSLVFLVVAAVAALLAPSLRPDALKFTLRLAAGSLAFFLVLAVVTTRERFVRVIAALLGGALVSAAFGLFEAFGGASAPIFALFKAGPTRIGGEIRVSASFQYATIASMYFEMVVPLILGAAIAVRRRAAKVALLLATAALIQVVISTLTRSGMGALAATFLGMLSLAWSRPVFRQALLPVGVAAITLVALVGALAARNSTFITRLRTEDEARWYGASYDVPGRLTLTAGEVVTVPVRVENTGVAPWQATGDNPFVLSYHWLSADGQQELDYTRIETGLPRDIAPGESVELGARVDVIARPGQYLLAWGMLQREILWFKDRGVPEAYSRVEVASTEGVPPEAPPEVPVLVAPRDETVYVRPPVRRIELWRTAIQMVRQRPLLGVGPDNYRHVFGEYAGQSEWDRNVHANNMYLEMFAGTGVLGGLAFVSLLLVAGLLALRGWWQAPADAFGLWSLALAGSLVAFLAHGLLDYFLEFTGLLLFFWMLLGLIVGFVRLTSAGGR
ncbi:MAG TPA: O-antigen ligase family protein [Ardenticatenaceae bacterium]|nr:O-antigen ligase family protein [Ardenticatenaceae bacterium]